jgi:hypothetical protein
MPCLSVSITGSSFAHISYSGRNFGTLTNVASSINHQLVSSNYGWADATDADWGDSHRTRFFRFNVAADGTQVRIAVQRNANASATGAQGTFLPGFSLYSGLAQLSPNPLGHDGSALSVQWLTTTFGNTAGFGLGGSGKEGVLNALGNWSVGNSVSDTIVDPADFLRSLTYVGHAADGQIVIVSSLNGLLREASALFDVQIDRLYTQAGAKVSELSVPSSGRSCLYDGTRCVYDGSSLFAASEGAAC